jgi:hypothetical protein
LLLVLAACSAGAPEPQRALLTKRPSATRVRVPARAGCGAPRGLRFFFPPGALFDRADDHVDELLRHWYSRVLTATLEPSLSCGMGAPQRLRFLSIPTFDPASFVRVELTPDGGVVWSGTLSGSGGYDPGQLVRSAQRKLLAAESRELSAAIAKAGFWTTPADDSEHDGFDGTQWVLEGRRGADYHVVHRWSPTRGAFRDLCRDFARLGGIGTH